MKHREITDETPMDTVVEVFKNSADKQKLVNQEAEELLKYMDELVKPKDEEGLFNSFLKLSFLNARRRMLRNI